MRPFLTCLVALAVTTYQIGATSAKPTPSYNQGINIIPLPKSLKEVGGSPFVLTAKTPLIAEGDSALTISRFFADKLNASTGYSLKVSSGSKNTSRGIFARIDPKLALGEEGYTLTSSPRGVELVGKTARALF
ncbi:MAG: beta-hexosaminidase, partial [Porphyromonadaceae bacterium]|nr:beta-hexosaminidase [Porphyromonadaceae bacterium]